MNAHRATIAAWCAFAVAAFAASAAAQQPIVTTILNNGPTQHRYDMVILGDGYQAHEQARFNQDCQTFLTALFQKQPYQTFAAYYNVHSVFRASQDSGASHPDASPPIVRNTAYGASYNTGGTARCLYITNTSRALADAALAPANEGRVLVMVNDSRYGGCAGQFAVSYNGSSMAEVQIHEIGHSLGGLADEYDYPNQTYSGSEPGQANITTSPTGQKWSHWHGFDGVSAFQGAGYYLYGLYRPRTNCLMRSLGIPLCAVCREQITRSLNSVVNVIESPQPANTAVTLLVPNTQTFSFTNLVPPGNNPQVTWSVDGQPVPGQTGSSFVLDSTAIAPGAHTVSVTVRDQTAIVRQDPQNTLRDTRTWNVTVTDPTAADLSLTTLSSNPVFVLPGGTVDVTLAVRNAGPAAASNFDVELFLSLDNVLTTSDVYLGRDTIQFLGVGQSQPVIRRVQLPWSLAPQLHYLFAIVDREDRVRETNENDNTRSAPLFGQSGPCTVALEFRDDLLYPKDAAAVSIQTGGTALPTVIARCAAPGTQYLIVWGCMGTSPGTTLAPGVHVPLNQDLCTQLGLAALNGPVFQQFWGTLDANGFGHATFQWPGGYRMLPQPGHFAAILLDGTPAFVGASNPVAIDLR